MSNNKTPIKHTVYESPSLSSTDIHKIIDDAMIKRDRSVSIFIMPTSMTININPSETAKLLSEMRRTIGYTGLKGGKEDG